MSIHTFTKADRLLKRNEFLMLSEVGRKISSLYFIAIIKENQKDRCRLGITVTKKVGKAAIRNKIKRISREIFRMNRHKIAGNWDINLITKKEAASIDYSRAKIEVEKIFKEISKWYKYK